MVPFGKSMFHGTSSDRKGTMKQPQPIRYHETDFCRVSKNDAFQHFDKACFMVPDRANRMLRLQARLVSWYLVVQAKTKLQIRHVDSTTLITKTATTTTASITIANTAMTTSDFYDYQYYCVLLRTTKHYYVLLLRTTTYYYYNYCCYYSYGYL